MDQISHEYVQNSHQWIELMAKKGHRSGLHVLTKTLIVRERHVEQVYYMVISNVEKKKINWTGLYERFKMKRQSLVFVDRQKLISELLLKNTSNEHLIGKQKPYIWSKKIQCIDMFLYGELLVTPLHLPERHYLKCELHVIIDKGVTIDHRAKMGFLTSATESVFVSLSTLEELMTYQGYPVSILALTQREETSRDLIAEKLRSFDYGKMKERQISCFTIKIGL
jgi:hypothetical protein